MNIRSGDHDHFVGVVFSTAHFMHNAAAVDIAAAAVLNFLAAGDVPTNAIQYHNAVEGLCQLHSARVPEVLFKVQGAATYLQGLLPEGYADAGWPSPARLGGKDGGW